MLLVIAASVQEELEKYGAYAGIAAFIGLAALTLLYFAQAKELKRLRDWAGRAPERAAEMEARVVAVAEQRRVQATPVPKPQAAPATAPSTAAAKTAAAGAAAGAGAAAAGTAVADKPEGEKPAEGEQAEGEQPPATPAPATASGAPASAPTADARAPGAAPAAPPATGAAAATAAAAAPAGGEGPPAKPPAPAPGTPAPAAAGAPSGAAPAAPGGQETQESDAVDEDTGEEAAVTSNGAPSAPPVIPRATPAQRPAAAALRANQPAASPRRAAPPRRPAPPPRRQEEKSSRGPLLPILGVIVVLGLGALAATQIFGGDEQTSTPPNTTPADVAPTTEPSEDGGETQSLTREETQVSVFNGTTISGLAATTADKLKAAGFPAPLTGNNPDQQRSATLVLYASRAARRSASEISELLKVSDPEAMDDRTRAQAGPEADVVVIVGSDQTQ